MNRYVELKRRQEKEVNEFPMFFAFSKEQFSEGMKKLGLEPDEKDKIYSILGWDFRSFPLLMDGLFRISCKSQTR